MNGRAWTETNVHSGLLREHLQRLQQTSTHRKPVLPRLRVECFRVGQQVHLLLADTPGTREIWADAIVCEVRKHHRPKWAHHFPSRGYYWRVTARAERPLLKNATALSFSTSEPRVLLLEEFEYLKRALHEDSHFVKIYCDSARRDWNPLWCDEADLSASGEQLDLAKWLAVA